MLVSRSRRWLENNFTKEQYKTGYVSKKKKNLKGAHSYENKINLTLRGFSEILEFNVVRAGRETGLSGAHRTIGLEVLCMVVRASSESQWNIYFCHLLLARDHQEHTCR